MIVSTERCFIPRDPSIPLTASQCYILYYGLFETTRINALRCFHFGFAFRTTSCPMSTPQLFLQIGFWKLCPPAPVLKASKNSEKFHHFQSALLKIARGLLSFKTRNQMFLPKRVRGVLPIPSLHFNFPTNLWFVKNHS